MLHVEHDRPSGRGDTGSVPEDRRTRTTAGGSPLWQSTQSTPEPGAAASAPRGLLWRGDVHLGSARQGKGSSGVLSIQPALGMVTSFANCCPVTNEPSFSQSGISVKVTQALPYSPVVGFSKLMFQKHCRFLSSWESSSLHP